MIDMPESTIVFPCHPWLEPTLNIPNELRHRHPQISDGRSCLPSVPQCHEEPGPKVLCYSELRVRSSPFSGRRAPSTGILPVSFPVCLAHLLSMERLPSPVRGQNPLRIFGSPPTQLFPASVSIDSLPGTNLLSVSLWGKHQGPVVMLPSGATDSQNNTRFGGEKSALSKTEMSTLPSELKM